MPWFRVDDTLHSHPKTRRAGLAALGLWAVAGSYCCQYTTEGFVADWFVQGHRNGHRLAQQLIDAGLWYRVGPLTTDSPAHSQQTHQTHYSAPSTNADSAHEPGYQFHDWHHFQMSKAEIDADREHNRERQRKFREKKRAARNAVTNTVSNGVSNGTPTLPNLTTEVVSKKEDQVSNAEDDLHSVEDEPRSKPVDVSAMVVARAYTDIVRLSDKSKVAGVVLNARLADFTDDQIRPALERLARNDMPVTADTLRIEINGRQNTNGHKPRGPKEIPGAGGGMTIQL